MEQTFKELSDFFTANISRRQKLENENQLKSGRNIIQRFYGNGMVTVLKSTGECLVDLNVADPFFINTSSKECHCT